MEIAKVEIAALEKATGVSMDPEVTELNELQLSLVGGGTGDVHFG